MEHCFKGNQMVESLAFDENKKNLSNRRPLSRNARNDFVLNVLKRFEKRTHKHFILLKSKTELLESVLLSQPYFLNFSQTSLLERNPSCIF